MFIRTRSTLATSHHVSFRHELKAFWLIYSYRATCFLATVRDKHNPREKAITLQNPTNSHFTRCFASLNPFCVHKLHSRRPSVFMDDQRDIGLRDLFISLLYRASNGFISVWFLLT